MIKKIVRIRSVGKLGDCVPKGDVEFDRLNLIFAPNGQGKTTVCDILRSFESGDADYVLGRQTLGSSNSPDIELRLESSTARFDGTSWSQTEPNLRIFGREFIERNVFTGSVVAHDHKRNLHSLILGERGVELANRVAKLDEDLRETTRAISSKEQKLTQQLGVGLTLPEFLSLQRDSGIEEKLKSALGRVRENEQAEKILRRDLLSRAEIPALPENLESRLATTLDTISADAESKVRTHLEYHTKGASEKWIGEGLQFVAGEDCPFCGQSLKGVDLVKAYKDYFSESYRDLKANLGTLARVAEQACGEAAIQSLLRTIEVNRSGAEFWSQFIPTVLPQITEDMIRGALNQVRDHIVGAVREKEAKPLEAKTLDPAGKEALIALALLTEQLQAYNQSITHANQLIQGKKEELRSSDRQKAGQELERLRASSRRFEQSVDAECAEYIAAVERKKGLEKEKQAAKDELDAYSGKVMATWETELNTQLGKFSAGFRLGHFGSQYLGGAASVSYRLIINDIPVDLGNQETPRNVPSFRNTLSDGDRATLALALFFLQLKSDPGIADRIVVFDDPFSSQDRSRRMYTQQCITRTVRQANQVIVLSHDAHFLKMLADAGGDIVPRAMQFNTLGNTSLLTACDLEAETRTAFQQDFMTLQAYRDESAGEPRTVARCIRPYLEGWLRNLFPEAFPPKEWLGDFIARIRAASQGEVLAAAQPILEELEEINDFSKRYHHENWVGEPVDGAEVHSYVSRALSLVRGF